MRPPDHFETERLVARVPEPGDAPAVFSAYASDPEVTTYLSWPAYTDVPALASFLAERSGEWQSADSHSFSWLVSLRDDPTPIGSIGVTFQQTGALFGYVLARRHWNRGLMSEVLSRLSGWALSQPRIYRAWAFCHVGNSASARVMEKAGMSREGVLRRWQRFPNLSPEPQDCLVYARTR